MRITEHSLAADDGWRLSVLDIQPKNPVGLVVAGHAMMVDRRTLWRDDRPCLATTLADHGLRVLVPDLRGHGESGPRAARDVDWSYDDLVSDVGVYLRLARELLPSVPCFLVGHSLFAHNSLAYLGHHPQAPVAGVVGLATNVWNRRWEPNRGIAGLQMAIAVATMALVRARGFLPVRALRLGTADEPFTYWREMTTWILGNTWRGRDGSDYHAGLTNITCPVLQVVSDADWLYGRPSQALGFAAPLGDRLEIVHLGRHPELSGLCPGHMEMVTRRESQPLWVLVARWIRVRCRLNEGTATSPESP